MSDCPIESTIVPFCPDLGKVAGPRYRAIADSIAAEIAAAWIEDGTADRAIERKRAAAAARQQIARTLIGRYRPRLHPASYQAWLELPPVRRTGEFVEAARRREVAVSPADLFAVGSGAPRNAVRVSLSGASDRAALTRGLTVLAGLLARRPPGRAMV